MTFRMPREVTKFFVGALFGVCVTVAVFYVRGPLRDRMAQDRAESPAAGRKVKLVLRPEERSLGDSDAPLTLVEFSDFQCPFCAQFNRASFPGIKRNYIDTGKLRFVHRNLPLPSHSSARTAALAALCANDQGAYWRLCDILFDRSECLRCEGSGVLRLAESAKLDVRKLEACLSANTHVGDLQSDIESAAALRIYATPTFILGRTTQQGVEGVVIQGAQPYEVFESEFKKHRNLLN